MQIVFSCQAPQIIHIEVQWKEKWLPFWGKFTSEIDSSNLAPLTKFGYLKELLEKHVRKDIDGLPFTDEGYANAKAILEAECGQPTEIVNYGAANYYQRKFEKSQRVLQTTALQCTNFRYAWTTHRCQGKCQMYFRQAQRNQS